MLCSETKPLKCLIALYVERCYHVWKNNDVLPWLEKNVKDVLKMVEMQDPEINNCQTKRMNWFKPTLPVNIKRHLMIYDLTDILILAGEVSLYLFLDFYSINFNTCLNTYIFMAHFPKYFRVCRILLYILIPFHLPILLIYIRFLVAQWSLVREGMVY